MTEPTPADQAAAAVIVAEWTAGSPRTRQTSDLREAIAAALAKERTEAQRPFLELARDFDDGSEWGMATHTGASVRQRILMAWAEADQ